MLVETTIPFHISVEGITHNFDAGVHDIHEKLAANWFVAAMTKPLKSPEPARTAKKLGEQ